jgi:hypothetical protein
MPVWFSAFTICSFELMLVQEIGIQCQSSVGRNPVFPAPSVEVAIFSPTHTLGSFVKNQLTVVLWVSVKFFYCIPLVFMSFCDSTCCSVENFPD